ncbi:hypothetical protein BABINDRAFT_162018 [Babjeviella inositovora NRRL Y-12698]|uniref:Nuclear pore protein n=1 Tax=Babjeviella inositovora NRRL Y-12698 TaxID=984486 RepID=A0A1E3QRG1_9ASCO|nr:uncharacterized protein BABINDRAFT_162018 [Babjeviella inositovora NRRL Y-12698]ODQ79642.1 hypothetical protein BABINDRAFT_162018 [Babjeviella inositovora NRRL Y-12698]
MTSGRPVTTSASGPRLLKELLEAGRNLPSASADHGTLQLSLNDIRKKAHDLRKAENASFTKAHYLLAGSGITAEEIETELKSIEVTAPQVDARAVPRAASHDIDSYLRAKKEENILSAIEQSLLSAAKDFDAFVNQNVTIDWKRKRDEIRESFGIGSAKKPKTHVTWGKANPGRNVLGPMDGYDACNNKQLGREKFEVYAQVVYQLNDARQNKQYFPLASTLGEVFRASTDVKSRQLHDTWKIVAYLTEERSSQVYQEKKFFKAYASTAACADLNQFDAVALRKKLVGKSKTYLERQFLDLVNSVHKKHLGSELATTEANNKVEPASNTTKVAAFISKMGLAKQEKTLAVNGVPIWPLVFYLLRAGLLEEALELTAANHQAFQKYEKAFPVYLKAYVDSPSRRLPQELHERLHTEFNQHIAQVSKTADPYRYAVYKLIGRCDLARKTFPVDLSIEDWLWCHLSLTREDNVEEDPSHERYTLLDLQRTVAQYGAGRFNGSNQNPFYLKALVLTGCFETAVEYLYTLNEADAVHLAIGLAYYGWLRVSKSHNAGNELMVINPRLNDQREINFARLMGSYTRFFRASDPKIAAQYVILICMSEEITSPQGKDQLDICLEALRELVLETREFSLLLGDINADGMRVPGVIEQRKSLLGLRNEEEYLHKVTEQVAVRADEEGRQFDAILLYQLAEEYDTVISTINKLLGELLSTTELDQPLFSASETQQTNIVLLATHLIKTFQNNAEIWKKIGSKNRETCETLLKLIDIRQRFVHQDWDVCLHKIGQLSIVPINEDDDLISSRRLAQDFTTYDENVARSVPALLIMTMTCVAQSTHQLKQSEFNVSSKSHRMNQLREVGKNCMIYAGMVQYRMPRETYSMLIGLEAML